ncbi:MAG: hypothetical protein LBE01_01290, partial [Deltaproteobacteria bacterium]|nr:hypothetical protein [Deltaproteobacteria bacterium]
MTFLSQPPRRLRPFFLLVLATLILALKALPALALPLEDVGAPSSLAEWEDWVMFGQMDRFCPRADSKIACAWPGALTVDLNATGGTFEAVWTIFRPMAVRLPGGPGAWPEKTTDALNGQSPAPIPAVDQNGPMAYLERPGRHVIKGQWSWTGAPDTLTLPLVPIVKVAVDGQEKTFPYQEIDYNAGTILFWLKDPQKASSPDPAPPTKESPTQAEADRLVVSLGRLIEDDQPIRVVTRVRLIVSGRDREEVVSGVLLPNSRATKLNSPLPARLTGQGLAVQVRPGVHEILVEARLLGQTEELGPVGELYGPENWAVSLNPALRQAQVSGADQVDASQTDLPWKKWPIYVLNPGQSLKIETVRRGDPEPGPDQLTLTRKCWLDFNGRGLSCRDQLTGSMTRGWQLAADPPFILGQASVNDQPQVLTWQVNSKGQKTPGFQVRRGQVDVTADLRLENFDSVLLASGWDHSLVSADQVVNLPPGYGLFHVKGARAFNEIYMPVTWWDRWNTLDLFVVLVIFLAALKTLGPRFAILAFLAVAFSYHEFMAPRLVILHVIGALALLKVLPKVGKAQAIVKTWLGLSAVFLVLVTVVFLIYQARITTYPQLDYKRTYMPGAFGFPMSEAFFDRQWATRAQQGRPTSMESRSQETASFYDDQANKLHYGAMDGKMAAEAPRPRSAPTMPDSNVAVNQSALERPNPEAIVQNSLARPDWRWLTVNLDFNRQIALDQEVRFYLIRPPIRRALCLVRMALIVVLILYVLSIISRQWSLASQAAPSPAPSEPSGPAPGEPSGPAPGEPSGPAPGVPSGPAPGEPSGPASGEPSGSAFNEASGPSDGPPKGLSPLAFATWALAALLAATLIAAPAAQAQTWPSPELLNELRARLTAPNPKDLPPGLPNLTIEAKSESLTMTFEVEATVPTPVRLPDLDSNVFQARGLTVVGGADPPLLMEMGSRAFFLAPAGQSVVVYEGRLKKTPNFQIRFPNVNLPKKVVFKSEVYEASGLDDRGYPTSGSIFLTLAKPAGPPKPTEDEAAGPNAEGEKAADPGAEDEKGPREADDPDFGDQTAIEPFFKVERTVSLGLEWRVFTTVTLEQPLSYPVTLSLPLLAGERPIASRYRTRGDEIILNFPPNSQRPIAYQSDLDKSLTELTLEAKEGPYS